MARPEPEAGALRYILEKIKEARALKQHDLHPEPERTLNAPDYLDGMTRKTVTRKPDPEQRGGELLTALEQRCTRHTLEEARALMREEIGAYLSLEDPGYMLLVKALPGVGKTTAAVAAAEMAVEQGRRILYAGPRHNFFQDILAICQRPAWWYEWLPRQDENKETGKVRTCQYARQVEIWMSRGYRAMDFCSRICGWDYVNDRCPYHLQKKKKHPIIFGQHQHVVLGHPLDFHVVIGDEYPIPVFCNPWKIPGRWVMPCNLPYTSPLMDMLFRLNMVIQQGQRLEGEDLVRLMGTPQEVIEACEEFSMPANAVVLAPEIQEADDVENVPYAYLQQFVPLLLREARLTAEKREFPHRIKAREDKLYLMLRRPLHENLPKHMIWLDATGVEDLYEACFGREVKVVDAKPELKGKVYQVIGRANGRSSLLDQKGNSTYRVGHIEDQVRHILARGNYQRPAVISFQGVIEQSEELNALANSHFYAARGTNQFEEADAMIIAGTPQPPTVGMIEMAKMIYFERDTPFDATWSTHPYWYSYLNSLGEGTEYDKPGFWGDTQLQKVLESLRECEIVQAAHRARPVNRPCDIWLLTNLPIKEIVLDEILTIRDLLKVPPTINVFKFCHFRQALRSLTSDRRFASMEEIGTKTGLAGKTVAKYIALMEEHYPEEIERGYRSRQSEVGRPCLGVRLVMREDGGREGL